MTIKSKKPQPTPVYLSADLHQRLKIKAAQDGVSIIELVKRAIFEKYGLTGKEVSDD